MSLLFGSCMTLCTYFFLVFFMEIVLGCLTSKCTQE
uniref:Uncharacterized protein n=1 Tax=Rhizophora mucronata TaxID=61149 RepID=A0A2P2NKL9_RHIMU